MLTSFVFPSISREDDIKLAHEKTFSEYSLNHYDNSDDYQAMEQGPFVLFRAT